MPSTTSDELLVKGTTSHRNLDSSSIRFVAVLLFLIICGIVLATRLAYVFLSDQQRFPISTIKVAASYKHVSHKELEDILIKYLDASFFSLPVSRLQDELNDINWIDTAYVEREWPATLKIRLVEKKPVALWADELMTADGKLFKEPIPADLNIPKLNGPKTQQLEVLQVYEKLSKILQPYNLKATGLELRENQSWVLILAKDTKIYLGKKELEARLERFCKAYPAVFAEKADQLSCVDLRYPRGMAVQWKQQAEQ